jgi:chromosomal replication initiator protein
LKFARFVPVPENQTALAAVEDLAASVASAGTRRIANPLYLHGPAGTGKTHLVSALIEHVTRRSPQSIITLLQSNDLARGGRTADHQPIDRMNLQSARRCKVVAQTFLPVLPIDQADLQAASQSDLVIVEDLQRLTGGAEGSLRAQQESLVQLFDYLHAWQRPMVFTATVGPGQLTQISARLRSRLAAGLVVALSPLGPASRLAVLRDKAQRRQLAVSTEVLSWVAQHLPGGVRQLEGAVTTLETLARLHRQVLDIPVVAGHFREQCQADQPTVEHIASRVGEYFHLDARHLQSRRRYRGVLLPRQVGMYLTRQLTDLSLEQIGSYFGRRDHSTVLHACRKIERALAQDAKLSGAVRQLHAALV